MGCDQGQENEQPVHRVWLDGFGMGKFPVTNREYEICVEDESLTATTVLVRVHVQPSRATGGRHYLG